MSRTLRTVCPHDCPDACSVLATVDDGRLISTRGNPDHPTTRGFLCVKVDRYAQRVHSPERLLHPLRRVGAKGEGRFERVSWDEALDTLVERIRRVQLEHGAEAILPAGYAGNQGIVQRNYPHAFYRKLGASRFDAASICDACAGEAWSYTLGGWGIDPEAIPKSDLVVAWGCNLLTTNVHYYPFVEEARRRGAPFVVIDVYRNRTARVADWFIPIRPGTDAALALGLMHLLVRDGNIDPDYIAQRTVGFEALRDQVLPDYPPSRVSGITGIPEADLEKLARMYGAAQRPLLRLGLGLSRHRHGGMAVRAIACIPGLTGAFQRRGGGVMLDTAAAFPLNWEALRHHDLEPTLPRTVSYVGLGRALTGLTPPIKLLMVYQTNPAGSGADQAKIREGLRREDLFVVVHDPFLNATCDYADLVLPATTGMENDDLYRSYGHLYLQYGPKVIDAPGEAWSNVRLHRELAHRMGFTEPLFYREEHEMMREVLEGSGVRLEQVMQAGWVKMADPPLGNPYHEGFRTPSGKLELYSEAMARDGLPPLPGYVAEPEEQTYPLRLLTLPGHYSIHSSWHGVASLVKRAGTKVQLNPQDAAARRIRNGDEVRLFNGQGEVRARAEVTDAVQPGLAVIEGYWPGQGVPNLLTPSIEADMGGGATFQDARVEVEAIAPGIAPGEQAG